MIMAFNEHDTFYLSKPIPHEETPVNTRGTVLLVFESDPRAYEVEFCDEEGNNLGSSLTFTLTEEFMTPEPIG